MIRVHVLTEPPRNQNTVAFLAPLLWNAPLLRARGIRLRFFYRAGSALAEADVLAVNSKIWPYPWSRWRERALPLLEEAGRKARVVFFDRSSTPGSVNAEVLALADTYAKTSVFTDRAHYTLPLRGGRRLFADYYAEQHGLGGGEERETVPPISLSEAGRIEIAWNTGFASYSALGPRLPRLHEALPWRGWFAPPRRFHPPAGDRPVAVSCRMGFDYHYESVAYQRRRMAEILSGYRGTGRLSRARYLRELRSSRIVASPFGYSEINYKDFETFLSGAVLLKPDMSHLETWPDYFRPGETFVAHRWDLTDVRERIAGILERYDDFVRIARAGQDAYRRHLTSREDREEFVGRFASLIGAP